MRKLTRCIFVLVAVVFILIPTYPVLAIDDPNTPPQVTAVYIFEDLLEDGDLGVLIDYYLDYDPAPGIPTEPVTESYLAAFIDIDGTTQLGTVAPYTFQAIGYTNNGYQRGVVWIYFTAVDVTAATIDRANIALHRVWLMGNPTIASGWAGVPPKTIAGIDFWQDGGDTATLFALRILQLASELEVAWTLDLVETTTLGSRLTPLGEAYFPNVINGLRTMAPNVFAVSTIEPGLEDLDYSTAFGATISDGTGSIPISPLALAEGVNIVDITGNGTLIVELLKGTVGTAADNPGGGTVAGSPTPLGEGTNTITVALAGTNDILVTVNLVDTASGLGGTVEGTGLDVGIVNPGGLTLPEMFGMSRWMISGLVWMVISVIIVAAAYGVGDRQLGLGTSSGKGMLMVFNLCIIIGTVLGLLHIIVGILLFLGFGFLTAYVLFFRGSSF